MAPLSRLCFAFVVLAVAPACGPSLTTVHEGTVRFEHCYRLDLESRANAAQRSGCWSLWLDAYTYGQSRDRIDYARRRLTALADPSRESPELKLAGEHRPEQRQFYLVVPAPSSVHASPPPIATVYRPVPADSADAGGAAPQNAKTPPAESCAASCRSAWQSCDSTCSQDGGTAKGGGTGTAKGGGTGTAKGGGTAECACKDQYAKCMRGCFE